MKHFKTLILITTVALLFSACSTKKAQTKKYFRLSVSTPSTVNTDIKPITLVVKRPTALSILGGRPIVATQADDSLVQLSHNFWIESPKVILQDRIKSWAGDHWQVVSYQTPSGNGYQILETRILAFEKKQNQAVVELEFFLYDENNQLLLNQQLSATENITTDNYKAFAQSISLAIEAVFAQLNIKLDGQL
ncbi:hypothetical protein MNBD_GAMMA02-285 [hydrothermal vent metagenome]|uniref:ABC-type transport auxiliary lipoprotein component domain-containing protein n=1 Tax=hydrothermal vent metagenome TaxID=652676 RepID=A0A3B0WNS4_9ZZZZ